MTYFRLIVLGVTVLAACAGCAMSSAGQASPGATSSRSEGFWVETPECHGWGIYNRAANMCVNGGGF